PSLNARNLSTCVVAGCAFGDPPGSNLPTGKSLRTWLARARATAGRDLTGATTRAIAIARSGNVPHGERATRLPAGLCVRNSLVRRNLLLGVQHHGAVWRHWGTWRVRSADPVLLVPCSLSRYVRVDYQLACQKVVAAGIDWRAIRVG